MRDISSGPPGQLTLEEGLTMEDGSVLLIEIGGTSFLIFNGEAPGYDSGGFSIATNLGGGMSWDTSHLGETGMVTVVPEPSVVGMVLVALGGLDLGRRVWVEGCARNR